MIELLSLKDFRIFECLEVSPSASLNILSGPNGAGKTSVLEAIALFGSGRSFRASRLRPLIRSSADSFIIYARTQLGQDLGVQCFAGSSPLKIRLNAHDVALHTLVAQCPVAVLEPASLDIFEGGGLHRRQLIDWVMFHVEPLFLPTWLQYQRALKQRNALLQRGIIDHRQYKPWDEELDITAKSLNQYRMRFIEKFSLEFCSQVNAHVPGITLSVSWHAGWQNDLLSLLSEHLFKDIERGYTFYGPHRADLHFQISGGLPAKECLSRGQRKLISLIFRKLQIEEVINYGGKPVVLLDDPLSELDVTFRSFLFGWIKMMPSQTWITTTEPAMVVDFMEKEHRMFHVEQGRVHTVD